MEDYYSDESSEISSDEIDEEDNSSSENSDYDGEGNLKSAKDDRISWRCVCMCV